MELEFRESFLKDIKRIKEKRGEKENRRCDYRSEGGFFYIRHPKCEENGRKRI